MAKLTKTVNEDFGRLLKRLEDGILNGSVTASLEESWDSRMGDARCSVRTFERYSYWGQNRVSMNLTLFQAGDGPVQVCATTSGGSQAVFFKINTIGEESFLEKLAQLL